MYQSVNTEYVTNINMIYLFSIKLLQNSQYFIMNQNIA